MSAVPGFKFPPGPLRTWQQHRGAVRLQVQGSVRRGGSPRPDLRLPLAVRRSADHRGQEDLLAVWKELSVMGVQTSQQ
eukprot:3424106-Rhodomonas_salina.2